MTEPSSSSSTTTITANKQQPVQTLPRPNATAQKWRTEAQQHMYSAKLIDALRRRGSTTSVREAADRVLAVSARGSTRWSRAMLLKRRVHNKYLRHKRISGNRTIRKPAVRRNVPVIHRKVRVLSRLVPGCRKLSLPNLLEETSDYIAALGMQVKALTFITALLNRH